MISQQPQSAYTQAVDRTFDGHATAASSPEKVVHLPARLTTPANRRIAMLLEIGQLFSKLCTVGRVGRSIKLMTKLFLPMLQVLN